MDSFTDSFQGRSGTFQSMASPASSPSFVRGIFAGALHDELLFPFPDALDSFDRREASVVRRLINRQNPWPQWFARRWETGKTPVRSRPSSSA